MMTYNSGAPLATQYLSKLCNKEFLIRRNLKSLYLNQSYDKTILFRLTASATGQKESEIELKNKQSPWKIVLGLY